MDLVRLPVLWSRNYCVARNILHGKCPKSLFTKICDKMAYAKMQTQIRQGLHCLPFTKYFMTQLHKKQNLVWNKVFEILGHLQYLY